MTNTFYKAFSSEQYKLSKNKEIFGILLLPIVLILGIDLYIAYEVNKSGVAGAMANPWKILLGRYVFQFFYLLYPILVSIFVYGCCDVEYKNNNYKILFTIPVSKSKIFFSKAAFIILTILFSVLSSYFIFLLSGYVLSLVYPEIGFQNYDYREVIFCTFLKLFITLSSISMVQLALSLIFRSFIYPIGFSIFMLVFSVMVSEKKWSDFIPYSGAYSSLMNIMGEVDSFKRIDYSNSVMLILFMLISFYLFIRKRGV